MDPGAFAEGLVAALVKVLTDWSNGVATATSEGAAELARPVIAWMRDSATFLVRTPRALVNVLDEVLHVNEIQPLLRAATNTALLLAAGSHIGHRLFGWRPLSDSLTRIGITLILVSSTTALLNLSLDVFDGLASGLSATIPDVPNLDGLNPIVLVVLLAIWMFMFGRLMYASGKRIAWLAILKPGILLASVTWIHPGSAWIFETLVKMWVGFQLAQVLVILALMVSTRLVEVGGFGGFIMSVASLGVAHDAIYEFAPKGGSISIPRIPNPIRR